MVQEVQQQGNWYQTPNEIQGIGDIRRRVREHTQVTPSFGYRATAKTSIGLSADEHSHSGYFRGNLTLSNEYGVTEFEIINGKLRIPIGGAYLVEMKNKGGTEPGATVTHELRVGNEVKLTQSTNDANNYSTINRVLNFGKYDLLEARSDLYWSGYGGYSSTAGRELTLQKL